MLIRLWRVWKFCSVVEKEFLDFLNLLRDDLIELKLLVIIFWVFGKKKLCILL